ncbi:replication factor C large subunit [Candidatus Woesearchaeota archaeon]|nr:replication factor C large subunit [Candidatus Woesearchaeota archaeon]
MGVPWTVQKVLAKDILQPGMAQLRTFLSEFKKQKKKAAFLYGPSGTGKTSAVHALAHELNLEILELNASDVRNADGIQSKLGVASQQMSLFSRSKVILVDEVDGLAGNNDRGGAPAIASLIADSKFPIVLTANDPWESKLSSVRSKSLMIEFPVYDYLVIAEIMKRLCARENVSVEESVLKTLARRSGGDLRAALTDLQTISISKTITKEHLGILGDRDREESMHNALLKVFKNSDPVIALTAFEHVGEDLDGSFLWVDENVPKEYTNIQDRARAYEALARADVYRGRIKRRQHWHFLTSVNALLSAGVAVAKDQKYPGIVNYTPTTRILKIWQANMKYQKRKAIAEKLAPLLHSSMKRTIKELPFLQVLFKKNTESSKAIADAAELDPEEIEWLQR